MTAVSRGNVLSSKVFGRFAIVALLATLGIGFGSMSATAAQSSGCVGGPFDGETALDSDGDGHTDAAEVAAGSDPCDSSSVISSVATATIPPAQTLALTGPDTAVVGALVGFVTLFLGAATLAVGRRVET
jgi:hypothetical protein